MINISEICIGNILHPDASDETLVATVKAIDENKISFHEYSAATPVQAKAVSLSDIWLQGYSFAYLAESKSWVKGAMSLQVHNGAYVFSLGTHSQVLRFVHQLQNLYLALFGEFLEIEQLNDQVAADEIQLAADSIMVNYLPKDRLVNSFSFELSVEGLTYLVSYQKDHQGYWAFHSFAKHG